MQITFDTDKDAVAKVLAVTHAAYGLSVEAVLLDTCNSSAAVAALEVATPSATIAPEDSPAAGQDTTQKDKDGLPWDARVHSTPPNMNADGLWRAKRGRKEEDYAAVKAEYRPTPAAAATPQPPAAPPAPPTMPGTPAPLAPVLPSAYKGLSDFLDKHIAEATNGCTAAWVKDSLTNMGVADGDVLNLQGEPDEKIAEIQTAFKTALGVA